MTCLRYRDDFRDQALLPWTGEAFFVHRPAGSTLIPLHRLDVQVLGSVCLAECVDHYSLQAHTSAACKVQGASEMAVSCGVPTIDKSSGQYLPRKLWLDLFLESQ